MKAARRRRQQQPAVLGSALAAATGAMAFSTAGQMSLMQRRSSTPSLGEWARCCVVCCSCGLVDGARGRTGMSHICTHARSPSSLAHPHTWLWICAVPCHVLLSRTAADTGGDQRGGLSPTPTTYTMGVLLTSAGVCLLLLHIHSFLPASGCLLLLLLLCATPHCPQGWRVPPTRIAGVQVTVWRLPSSANAAAAGTNKGGAATSTAHGLHAGAC